MSQAKAKAVPIGLGRVARPGRWESTANLARMIQPDLSPQPSPRISPRAWPTHKREAEERMTSILDMMRTYNLIDFKFWLEIAAVLFVMTVGRDAFLQQWLGGSH